MTEVAHEVVGYEVVWMTALGLVQRALFMDRDRALIYAARYGGTIHKLVRIE